MRRDDFPLKTSHVLIFVKEEYSDFATAYLAKNKEENLEAEQRKFASEVGAKVKATYERACIFNAGETAVYYDDTPTRIINELSVTGRKLRPVVIFKGQPGGGVEEEVQGISNREAWGGFVSDVAPGPLALYVDNFKCHVSTEAQEALAAWGTEMVPLPKNTTSVLQPLDVGVMGPFKQKLRAITLSYELSVVLFVGPGKA
ncbi:hypothetical protein JG688_00018626 [Phytophthora aleatoria]|uniref:DDE-1 domain-containing protein n=1 Tax=Phytophthora aleatoria TaxID=2496075 RepID=A0A8J5MBC9_9STRA|nr:hypothetical protein JG688_00018626 [Phytophthora aleatoria]